MAKKIIKRADLVAANAITSVTDEAKKLVTQLEKILKAQREVLKNNPFKSSDDVKNHKKATSEVNTTINALLATRKKLAQSTSKSNQLLEQEKIKLQEQSKANKLLAKDKLGLISAYDKESRTLNELRKKYKNVALSMGENSKQARKLKAEVVKLDTKLKKVDKSAGQFQRNVGNYPKIFSGAAAAMGAAFLSIGAITRVFGDAIRRTREFEQSNANLASVLGTTSDNIKELTTDAKRLGAETSFSASQVALLQTEFAKLGFNKDEILSATEATLSLAAATGTVLADAAAVAGGTMGGFGLKADETQRVVDVMAQAFSSSALDMEKFKESMKDAAPAAKAIGVDIERTTALLGTLANANISGSKAGTALKAGFIELNAEGISLDKALNNIATSQDKLAAATELVGKRAATSFLVLADGVEITKELEKGLNNSGGAAKRMAETQLDTLSGSIKILDSAWEGLILSLLEGDGIFSDLSRGLVDFATSLLGVLTTTENITETTYENAKANKALAVSSQSLLSEYEDLVSKGLNPTAAEKERLDIITLQLTDNLGDSVLAINKETGAYELNVESVRAQIKIKRLASDEEAATLASRLVGSQQQIKDLERIEKENNKELDLRRKINKETGATDRREQDFKTPTKTGKILNTLNKEQLKSQNKLDESIINARTNKEKLNIEREKEIDLLKKLKELNFSQEDIDAFIPQEVPDEIEDEDKIIKTEKKKAKIRAKAKIDAEEDEALSIEFDLDSKAMLKQDADYRAWLKKQEEESAASLEKMKANKEKIRNQEILDDEAALKAKLAKEEEMRLANIDTITGSINTIGEAMNSASSDRIKQLDEDTRQNDKALETQERRAEQGLKNNAGALRAEQDKLKAGKKREQEEQVRNNKILAYINLASEYAKDDANTAPFKALATIGTMEAITALFEEGTDKGVEADMSGSKVRNTGKDDYLGRTKSGKAFLFDGREKIMGIQHSAALTDYTNQQIVDIVQNSEKGGMMASISLNDSRIVSRLDSLEKSINNSKVSLHIDENAFVTHTQFVNGMKKVSKSKPKRLY